MLLEKLKLYNFRPFKGNHEICFSTDKEKNVTLVMAGNGAGKTTLAQAFQWVLYGRTDGFKNKSVLNTIAENELENGQSTNVCVELELEHNGINYIISRKQVYRKDSNGNIKQDPSTIDVINKEDDGQVDFPSATKNLAIISNIMPESLSKYFFFDGERIDKMATGITDGKSEEFKDAVQNILGLTALNKAIDHLNPGASTSVIGRYNSKMDQQGDEKTKENRQIVYDGNQKISEKNSRINELEEEIGYYTSKIEEIKNELLTYQDVEKAQKQLNVLNSELEEERKYRSKQIEELMKSFSNGTTGYMSRELIKDALRELANTNNIDKGIPDITKDTIEHLLKSGKCICGSDLSDQTSDHVRTLLELLDYIPPESLGGSINSFKDMSNASLKNSENFYSNFEAIMSSIRRSETRVDEYEHKIGEIDQKILSSNNSKISDLKKSQKEFENNVNNNRDEIKDLNIEIGKLTQTVSDAEAELSRLQLKISTNKVIQEQLMYAKKAYDVIKATYDREESSTRQNLEDEINEMFKQIYAGGMSITVDEKYRIKSYISDLEETTSDLDANTARSYSIIFAFIVSVISIAKQKINKEDQTSITDEYPLVMDAPLSSFDQRRIKNICQVIPSIARQVIIFIKDTDGNLAKEEMSNKIGIEYNVYLKDKDYPLDSTIEKVGE